MTPELSIPQLAAPCACRLCSASLPMHLAGAVFGVLLGGTAMSFSWFMAAVVAAYAVVLVLASRWMLKRLRGQVDSAGVCVDGYEDAPTELVAGRPSC